MAADAVNTRGFSLVETLIATALLATAATALAQLFVLSTRANQIARATTIETLLAEEKMEELRLQAAFLAGGSLLRDESGYSDLVDGYTRRWAIDSLSAGGTSAFVLQVLVKNSLPGEVRVVDIARR